MRESLGVVSGLLALLFAAGVFSLLLLDAPSAANVGWGDASGSSDERAFGIYPGGTDGLTVVAEQRSAGTTP